MARTQVRHLPDLWHLPAERLAAMQSIAPEFGGLVQDASHALADIAQDFTESYRRVPGYNTSARLTSVIVSLPM